MKQAKTLTAQELKRVLAVVAVNRHAQRNRLAVLLSYYAGLRVKEIAALRYSDVFDSDQAVRRIVTLTAEQTKGKQGRIIVINDKLAAALTEYRESANKNCSSLPLIRSQKGKSFSANSLCQVFLRIAVLIQDRYNTASRMDYVQFLHDSAILSAANGGLHHGWS